MAWVIWVLGWPLVCAITSYLTAMRNKVEGKPPVSDNVWAVSCVIDVIVWIAVARLIGA